MNPLRTTAARVARRWCWPQLSVAALAALLAGPVATAPLYKYRDAEGRWVFSDRKPSAKEQVQGLESSVQLRTAPSKKVAVVNRGTRKRPVLYAVNQLAGPVEFWLEFPSLENVRFSVAEPHIWLVPGTTEQVLLHLEQQNRDLGWSYQWAANYVPGPPVVDSELNRQPLAVPFSGGPYVVSQAFHGKASHHLSPQSHYAVDIALPENTPVLAVRPGVVMEIEKDFSRAGWSAEYADEANFVRVLHADGSMAVYAHLAMDSLRVAQGQRVFEGQVLAHSGHTGFSTGPHLHFVLQVNRGRELVSIPFEFAGAHGAPQQGDVLTGRTLQAAKDR